MQSGDVLVVKCGYLVDFCGETVVILDPGPEVIKLFSCSTQLSTKCISAHEPYVGILTFISKTNTTSKSIKARKSLFFSSLVFMSI